MGGFAEKWVKKFSGNDIIEITPGGTQSIYASLTSPGDLAFDGAGDLFVGSKNNYGASVITEIAPDGTQSTFATAGSGFIDPSSMAFQPVPELQGVVANGCFQLTVAMPYPYYTTIVQASTNLVNWVNVCTNTPPFAFTDSVAACPSRFYRAVLDTNFY